jgi:hypothetical protein
MRNGFLLGLCLILAAGPAFGGAAVEQEGPLTPCVQTPGGAGGGAAAQAQPWGIEIATAFSSGAASREDADALCAKLMASGGACIVQKN